MLLDVFKADAFSMSSLTEAINLTPYKPGRIASLGYFQEEGVSTTTIQVERSHGSLRLVPNTPRGGISENVNADKRDLTPFIVPHLPERATIYADEIQNLRAFGQEGDVETMTTYVGQRLATMRSDIDATIEHHRMGAIKGQVMDSDGTSVIIDLFTSFGLAQSTMPFNLDTDTTDVRANCIIATRAQENILGGAAMTGSRALCSDSFFDAFIAHPKVVSAYDRWNEGEFNRNDPRAGFLFGGIIWENYRGSVGGVKFVQDDTALLIPEGVRGLFITRFAPADTLNAANSMGLAYYAMQEELRMNKGIELEAQSNPANLCTRPDAIIKLGLGATVPASMTSSAMTVNVAEIAKSAKTAKKTK